MCSYGVAFWVLLCSLVASTAEIKDACPFDLKDVSGWDIAEFKKEQLREAYGVPKHSFGYRVITEAPTGFIANSTEATRILGSVFEPYLYKLNATKPDLSPQRTCSQANWHEKLEVMNRYGEPVEGVRGRVPHAPDCDPRDCSCYLRYSDSCPTSGYKTYYLPIPWWWCYYKC